MNRFNSGGKEFEDNGGLPMLPAQQQVNVKLALDLHWIPHRSGCLHNPQKLRTSMMQGTMDLQDNQTHGFHRYSQSGNRMQGGLRL